MANIKGIIKSSAPLIISVDADPSASSGTVAQIGTLAILASGTGGVWQKVASGATAWNPIVLNSAAGTPIHGTNTNDNAAAGFVGEFISANPGSDVSPGSSLNMVNIASISLTSGDWDVEGCAVLNAGTITGLTDAIAAISTSSASFDSTNNGGIFQVGTSFAGGGQNNLPTGSRRISINTTTTVFLVGELVFVSLGTALWKTASIIRARRVR